MNPNSHRRCVLVCSTFIVLFSAFSFRLIYLQVIKHEEYSALAAEKHVYKQIIYAERGSILDANNEVLAHNIPVETVVADATHLNDREAIVDLVGKDLGDQLGRELRLLRADVDGSGLLRVLGKPRCQRFGFRRAKENVAD